MAVYHFQPDLPPPAKTRRVSGWMRKNLFSSPLNTVFTFIFAYITILVLWKVINWGLIHAEWSGSTRDALQMGAHAGCLLKSGLSNLCKDFILLLSRGGQGCFLSP